MPPAAGLCLRVATIIVIWDAHGRGMLRITASDYSIFLQQLSFSSDDRWLVFWDDRGVEVLDLKERRHVGKFDIANVHAASFEGSSGILRLDFGELSMCWCHLSSR